MNDINSNIDERDYEYYSGMDNENEGGSMTYKKGDIVEIENRTMGGKLVNEGKAELIKFISKHGEQESWKVRFLDDGMVCYRLLKIK